jgi:hypothetical protein
MSPKPKLRSVKPTAKETIVALEVELQAAKDDAASWKAEAADAEKQIQEAIRLLGMPSYAELPQIIKDLRDALDMTDEDRRSTILAAQQNKEAVEDIARYEKDKDAAEANASALDVALSAALEDRAALLKHVGLSPRQWWGLGGAHEAHLYVRNDTEE